MSGLRNQHGFSFMSVLLALLIAAVLYFGYFKLGDTSGERSKGITAINVSRDVACRTQRQNIERDITMWSADHGDEPPTIEAL